MVQKCGTVEEKKQLSNKNEPPFQWELKSRPMSKEPSTQETSSLNTTTQSYPEIKGIQIGHI